MNALKSRSIACILWALLPAAGAHAELTFTSWGGSYAKAQLETAVTPFMRNSGVKLKMEEYAGGLEELRRQVNGGNVSWDVVDMTEPVEEAWEMVEHGTITEDNFRDFAFMNPLRLHAGMNPDVFKGTVIEKAAAEAVAKGL